MVITRRFPLLRIIRWGLPIALMAGCWAALIFFLYSYVGLTFLRVPFLPIATVGTAVAFYVGFKNNAAYERFWEGRKIWGGIVNSSRMWGTSVLNYTDAVGENPEAARAHEAQIVETRRRLIYGQMAWINALRLQLRKTSRFFHKPAATTAKRLKDHKEAMRNDWDKELSPFLEEKELSELSAMKNTATHILDRQAAHLRELHAAGRLNLFCQLELMKLIEEFYALQGKCERIKNTPFPRQYAEFSRLFTRVFVVLLPFGLLSVFGDHFTPGVLTLEELSAVIPMIVASALVTWVFYTMEGIGDSSEDPFERSMNDVPMNALCRTIEIDLRQMLGETDLPEKEPSVDGLLY